MTFKAIFKAKRPEIQLRENNQNSVVLTKFQNLVVLTKFQNPLLIVNLQGRFQGQKAKTVSCYSC